jgi:hypothetical protein
MRAAPSGNRRIDRYGPNENGAPVSGALFHVRSAKCGGGENFPEFRLIENKLHKLVHILEIR